MRLSSYCSKSRYIQIQSLWNCRSSSSLLSETCSLRLDFETFVINGPVGSDELTGGNCTTDRFAFSGQIQVTMTVPVICGINSDMHGKIFGSEIQSDKLYL